MRILPIAASLIFATGAAFAAPPSAPQDHSYACRPFMERYCSDTKWGQGRRIACLAKHKDQVNAACRERLELMQQVFALTQKNLAEKRKQEAEETAKRAKSAAPAAKPQPK